MVPFFVVVSYLAVLFPVSGYCLRSVVLGFFGRCRLYLGLDSEYMLCISTGRFMDELHNFHVEWTRILMCFSSFAGRMEKCAQSLQVA